MKTIPLTHGKEAIVDDIDYPALSVYKWHAMIFRGRWHAIRYTNKKYGYVKMHRQIAGALNSPVVIKHINRNSLDNRRMNLRASEYTGFVYSPIIKRLNQQRKKVAKTKSHYKPRDNSQILMAIESVLYEIQAKILYGMSKSSAWLFKADSDNDIREPKVSLCYNPTICHCGQIFYTEGEIPKHICNNQLTEIKVA